jgi:hypothetical protein
VGKLREDGSKGLKVSSLFSIRNLGILTLFHSKQPKMLWTITLVTGSDEYFEIGLQLKGGYWVAY